MSKKNKHKKRMPEPPVRRFTPLRVGIGLGFFVLAGALLFAATLSGSSSSNSVGGRPPLSKTALGTPLFGGSDPNYVSNLPSPAPGTRVPLNSYDPLTGKQLTASSPTTNYKGYTIGFCCAESEGYRGGWARWSEREKDAFVSKHLK